ncbi:MAG: AAA family ATPase [Aquificaceae bacterium]|nr:AAA family ATPase [Aquificaceae bacterium]MDW8423915.1 AAA family ATPase [Aquificaceae bacterium]
MLVRLTLENFFLIKNQEVYFDKGLNVITGETGTGKSLTVSSLLFLMGQDGEYPEGACVEAELFVEGETTILRRELTKGRSRYYLNGRGSNKKVVEEILSSHVLIQGQNDRTKIIRADFQRDLYDRFAQVLELREKVEKTYQDVMELTDRLKNLRERRLERELKKRLMQEEIKEVEEIGLRPEEYQEIRRRVEEINLAERINKLIAEGILGLESATEGIKKTAKAVRELSQHKGLNGWEEVLDATLDNLLELGRKLEGMLVSYNQEELNLLNEKLYRVQRLERKHRMDYFQIWKRTQELKRELEKMQEEEDPETLERELAEKERELEVLYGELSRERLSAKALFEEKVMGYIRHMGLERASFKVDFEEKRGRYGKEQVRFLFSSYGRDEKELGQVASGGEVSRLSLALFMLSPPAQAYVLDEVDAGISGQASLKLAKLLRRLSKNTQLIVITHSPAIASAGDRHLSTRKEFVGDTPFVKVVQLEGQERLQEIARLMGKVSQKTLEGAKELMKEVQDV